MSDHVHDPLMGDACLRCGARKRAHDYRPGRCPGAPGARPGISGASYPLAILDEVVNLPNSNAYKVLVGLDKLVPGPDPSTFIDENDLRAALGSSFREALDRQVEAPLTWSAPMQLHGGIELRRDTGKSGRVQARHVRVDPVSGWEDLEPLSTAHTIAVAAMATLRAYERDKVLRARVLELEGELARRTMAQTALEPLEGDDDGESPG